MWHLPYARHWNSQALVSINEAIAAVRFFPATVATLYNDERFGTSEVDSGLNYVNCPTGATNVTSQCNTVRRTNGACYLKVGKCSTEYSLQCYSKCDESGSFDTL